ncbi:hypothetical protein ACFQJ8_08500 [Halocatena marina]|uniref:hypothetical protein n=1 Tax=Halocatena marina TaxID=2934937 RepID=UPI003614E019
MDIDRSHARAASEGLCYIGPIADSDFDECLIASETVNQRLTRSGCRHVGMFIPDPF